MKSLDNPEQGVSEAAKTSKSVNPLWIYGGIAFVVLVIALITVSPLTKGIEHFISELENSYQRWFKAQNTSNPIVLLPLAFAGGLIASVSPCILALLPLNLSYIGTRNIASRWDAFVKAGSFVLGASTVLSLFGLFSAFAGTVIVDYKGYLNIAVGAIVLLMGLSLLGILKLPLPQMNMDIPIAGPYGVGVTFALVSSPCASPVLFAVLAAAAASGSSVLGALTMVSYALGYTAILFFSSLFAGLAKQARGLLQHSETIVRVGSVALILTGGYYLFSGVIWFL